MVNCFRPILACHLLLPDILFPDPSMFSYLCILSPIKASPAPHIASNLRRGLGMRSLKHWVMICARRRIKWENPPILFPPFWLWLVCIFWLQLQHISAACACMPEDSLTLKTFLGRNRPLVIITYILEVVIEAPSAIMVDLEGWTYCWIRIYIYIYTDDNKE